MHIPSYARATIRAALPTVPTARQVGTLDCAICDAPFEDREPVPLGPTPASGLFGCRDCLTRLIARARRSRDSALARNAEHARAEWAAWARARDRYLAGVESVREASEAVARLAAEGTAKPLEIAWLLVALESAHSWTAGDAPKAPNPVDPSDSSVRDAEFRLGLELISAREAVAERLAYHLINEAIPAEPEMCEEFDCPDDCSGRHDSSHIDCGPDAVFEDLARRGVVVPRAEDDPAPALDRTLPGRTKKSAPAMTGPAEALAQHGIDTDDIELLLDAAAAGLVTDAWHDALLSEIPATAKPAPGEILAQRADLYRRARRALVAARDDGPQALRAFQAVASSVDLPWAGGSPFTLRESRAATENFIQHIDDRIRYTSELMREQGWRAVLLRLAASAASRAPDHFGMPGWADRVASVTRHLAELDRSDAPPALADLGAVETLLVEAPDRLGADALGWILDRRPEAAL
ncbi:hypothetical protein [Streptomyces murinus]|uniref:Uncharacterized protein n=1 Tax=Streptomyces murinus TaxID=33900 RepID=A0A7W3NMK5_STRMR|nr:hypothetical protein [Streptomyces murinus]MBA9053227.1 hypothetical protein [Streptomyces murinus]UWW94382.1 hypothetical protein GO605_28730 [Streptomyces murinus]